MGARETLPDPSTETKYIEVLEQLKLRDQMVAQAASDQIAAMKAQIDSEILPQLGDFLPKKGGILSGPLLTMPGTRLDLVGADALTWPPAGGLISIRTAENSNFNMGSVSLYAGGATNNSLHLRQNELLYNDNDLGRWAAIDPNSLMPKTGGDFTGLVRLPSNAFIGYQEKISFFGGNQVAREAGACLDLHSGSESSGNFILYAERPGYSSTLIGEPHGVLSWNGKDLGKWANIAIPGLQTSWTSLNIAAFGATIDPYAALTISCPADLDYSYLGFVRQGNQALGMGINRLNQFFIGTSSPHAPGLAPTLREYWLSIERGNVYATTYKAQSDARRKKDFALIESALSKLDLINGYLYSWIDTGKPAAGLIAQEVETILPVAVSENEGVKSLDYNAVVALLVNAVRELKTEVRALRGA